MRRPRPWPAPDLKRVIMDCYFAGLLSEKDAIDLIRFYGLAGD
jgi:hypothetical protein